MTMMIPPFINLFNLKDSPPNSS